jgi:hypothetical protein
MAGTRYGKTQFLIRTELIVCGRFQVARTPADKCWEPLAYCPRLYSISFAFGGTFFSGRFPLKFIFADGLANAA